MAGKGGRGHTRWGNWDWRWPVGTCCLAPRKNNQWAAATKAQPRAKGYPCGYLSLNGGWGQVGAPACIHRSSLTCFRRSAVFFTSDSCDVQSMHATVFAANKFTHAEKRQRQHRGHISPQAARSPDAKPCGVRTAEKLNWLQRIHASGVPRIDRSHIL